MHLTSKHSHLICVDSDGCAMDTMDIKHFRCFGPAMVEEWSLTPWQEEILQRWNNTNLYSMTRGINRFQGLSIARAAAADPAVLLLDEITANLDADTEARVLDALRRASVGRTVLSISHRVYESLGGRTIEIKPLEDKG